MIPAEYAKNWKPADLVPGSTGQGNWKATIVVRHKTSTMPYMSSAVFTIELGPCADEASATKVFETIQLNIPINAYISFEHSTQEK